MLRIRLTRTGKNNQPSYRIVVAEHTAPIKSQFVEILGHYNLARTPRELTVDQDRVKYWVSVGAKPTDSVAVLLKSLGMDGMDKFIVKPRDRKRRKRNASEEAPAATVATVTPAEVPVAPEVVMTETPEVTMAAPAEASTSDLETMAAPVAPAEQATPVEEAPVAVEPSSEKETSKEVSAE